jgi:hypothetical protein
MELDVRALKTLARQSLRRIRIWQAYWRSFANNRPPQTRFVYFAHSRSGSHLFADLVGAHPLVECVTEHALLWGYGGIVATYRYIDGVSKASAATIFGGKINISQLERQRVPADQVIAELAANGWRFIILERKNTLEQVFSALVAQKRRQYHDISTPSLQDLQITVDLRALHEKLDRKTATNKSTRLQLAPYDPLIITYEDDLIGVEAQQRTADQVFAFLGIESVPVRTRYVKSAVYAPSDYILNYDEVVASLKGTPYVGFLPRSSG